MKYFTEAPVVATTAVVATSTVSSAPLRLRQMRSVVLTATTTSSCYRENNMCMKNNNIYDEDKALDSIVGLHSDCSRKGISNTTTAQLSVSSITAPVQVNKFNPTVRRGSAPPRQPASTVAEPSCAERPLRLRHQRLQAILAEEKSFQQNVNISYPITTTSSSSPSAAAASLNRDNATVSGIVVVA